MTTQELRQKMAQRAAELLDRGYTPLRIYRALKREFPMGERFDQLVAAGLGPSGTLPLWAEHGRSLRPVICRRPPGVPRKGMPGSV